MIGEFSDDAIAERFADSCFRAGISFLWLEKRQAWFARERDDSGAPVWAPDEGLTLPHLIRVFLRGLAEELPQGSYQLRFRLGSLATMHAVEELMRAECAGTEADLEPGALARQEVREREIIEAIRKHHAGCQQTPQAAPTPRKPGSPALPAVKITLSRRAKAAKHKIEAIGEYSARASGYAGLRPVEAAGEAD